MDLTKAIFKAYRIASERSWNTIYIFVDVHDTICGSNYKDNEASFFPQAIDALRKISAFPEVFLVLWTSCYPDDTQHYLERLRVAGINFRTANETPVENTKTGDFSKKPYFSILIDDKAGFDPEDWFRVYLDIAQARDIYPLSVAD